MKTQPSKIVVAGDVAIDWLQWKVPARGSDGEGPDCARNWQLHEGTRMAARAGGALLLARLLAAADVGTVVAPEITDLERVPPSDTLHSSVSLATFAATSAESDRRHLVLRVERQCGYAGPESGVTASLRVKDDDPAADIVVLDDAANGFRDEPATWPEAILEEGRQPVVIVKMSRPLAAGRLWEELVRRHGERLVLVINADDLRCRGMNISRRLSWERTAKDFVWHLAGNRDLAPFADCQNLVVRFDTDGVIHCTREAGRLQARLYYDPARIEGGFAAEHPGEMIGLTATFLAALAARVARSGLSGVGEGVRDGLRASRRLYAAGFGRDGEEPDYPVREVFGALPGEPKIADIAIPPSSSAVSADPDYWTILTDVTRARLEAVAFNYVEFGTDPVLDQVPVGWFGKLKTIDRTEIEGYRSVENLIGEYVRAERVKRPLCIGVFGPPGAGKTFAVTEIAKSAGPGVVHEVDFNLAQWESSQDLVRALHQVRDVVLGGQVPLVFFDEFDSGFQGVPLGWLKYFLDPMQSGKFKDGEVTHPIGKAIFVFAGATSSSLADFSGRGDGSGETDRLSAEKFREQKGPDFVSRLRGYVNILGVNPGAADPDDRLCMIRRAVALRAQLEMNAKHLVDRSGRVRIDPGVLRALIKIPEYRHGMRSMESIIGMSALAGRRTFEQSALPPVSQLDLHVDGERFARLMARDVIFGRTREAFARAAHEAFLKDNLTPERAGDPSMQPWDDLTENYRESDRQQVDHFPAYLEAVGCGYIPTHTGAPRIVEFTIAEVEKLALLEHERWLAEKLATGWMCGPKRDEVKKTNPCIVPWEGLPEAEREKDRQAVRKIPQLLADAGFDTYRLDE